MTTPAPKGLHAKLAEVMKAVGYVAKTGQNTSQGYKFVEAAAVADKVRDEFARLGITMIPTTVDIVESGLTPSGKQRLAIIRTTWMVTDSESGQYATFQSLGSGADSGDKAEPKAQTNAMKYGLLMAFQIPTGDDPEADPKTDEIEAGHGSSAPIPRVVPNKAPKAAKAAPLTEEDFDF